MSQDSKRAAFEWDREDRISDLPRNVIDHILELLPAQDAARTSILSNKWRNIWTTLPYLVLDTVFCNKLALKSQSILRETVDEILLEHIGDIVKFVLDISGTRLSVHRNIDRWIRYVTRNGVKELTLNVSDITYKLPPNIFNCPTLTSLELFNCVFKPPSSFLGFQNLVTLHLEGMAFVTTSKFCVINVPLLVNLYLLHCYETQCLNIVAPRLDSLLVCQCHYLELNCFMKYKNLRVLSLEFGKMVDNPKHDERSTLEKLLFSLSSLEELVLDSFVLELLSANIVPDGLPFMLNCAWSLSLGVDFDKMGQISYALQLIKSSPNLTSLHIRVDHSSDSTETVLKYLDTPTCLKRPLNKLEYVNIYSFENSKVELLFVKLLFACTPSLVRMCIQQGSILGSNEERCITIELMRFPRASPKAELCYYPYSD